MPREIARRSGNSANCESIAAAGEGFCPGRRYGNREIAEIVVSRSTAWTSTTAVWINWIGCFWMPWFVNLMGDPSELTPWLRLSEQKHTLEDGEPYLIQEVPPTNPTGANRDSSGLRAFGVPLGEADGKGTKGQGNCCRKPMSENWRLSNSGVQRSGRAFTYHLASSPGGRELVWLVLSSHRIPPEGRQRATEILREAARLNHSGILEVREAAVDRQGRPFMVHGIPKGTTLETLLKKNGALDVAFALSIGIQVGHALQHAHEKGIVLGTLEEAHVLVDESGAVRVRGFVFTPQSNQRRKWSIYQGEETRILSRGPGCFGGWSASRIGTPPGRAAS